jgi:hypothetical protein
MRISCDWWVVHQTPPTIHHRVSYQSICALILTKRAGSTAFGRNQFGPNVWL